MRKTGNFKVMKFQLLAGMVEGSGKISKTLLDTLRRWSDALNFQDKHENQS
jgi:hypothetical protein